MWRWRAARMLLALTMCLQAEFHTCPLFTFYSIPNPILLSVSTTSPPIANCSLVLSAFQINGSFSIGFSHFRCILCLLLEWPRMGRLGGSVVSVCLWLQVWSRVPGIESCLGFPAGSLLLPLPMSLPLSLYLSWINKILKQQQRRPQSPASCSSKLSHDALNCISLWNVNSIRAGLVPFQISNARTVLVHSSLQKRYLLNE